MSPFFSFQTLESRQELEEVKMRRRSELPKKYFVMSFSEHIQGPARFGGGQEGGPDPQFLRNLLSTNFEKLKKKFIFSGASTDF